MFELVVEATYPVDQAASFSLILFSGAIQKTFLMALERVLYRPLSEAEMEIQICADKEDRAHEQAKDYLPYTIFVQAYSMLFSLLYIIFFYPEMKRSKVDRSLIQKNKTTTEVVPTDAIESENLVNNDVQIEYAKN